MSKPRLIRVRDRELPPDRIVEALRPFVSASRRDRIERVLSNRTLTVAPVIEGVFDLGNVSAVMRSAEALGYQSLHIVESSERFKTSTRTTQGSDKWLDVYRWPDPSSCIDSLKQDGYEIVVTHLEATEPLDAIDFTKPTALVFGNEAQGVSDQMLDAADSRCIIPMVGFVESFNISVAAAVCLYHAHRQRVDRLESHGDLDDHTRKRLEAEFYMKSVKESEAILDRIA